MLCCIYFRKHKDMFAFAITLKHDIGPFFVPYNIYQTVIQLSLFESDFDNMENNLGGPSQYKDVILPV